MKAKLLLLFFVIVFAGCKTAKTGCPASKSSGPKYKTSKFDWYNG